MPVKTFTTNSPQHAAMVSSWGTLKNALSSMSATIYLNEYGENLPPGYNPYAVAQAVKQGAVWVDWCGWPMYGANGQQGFTSFLTTIGVSLPGVSFDGFNVEESGVSGKFARVLTTTQALNPPFHANPYAPSGISTSGSVFSGTSKKYWYSSFVVYYGAGAYVYAFGNDGQSYGAEAWLYPGAAGDTGVSPSMLIPFVQQVANKVGASGGSSYTPPPGSGSGGTGTTGYSGGGSQGGGSGVYPTITATLNGKPISAVAVNNKAYLSVSGLAAQGITPHSNGAQVTQNGQAYVIWAAVPGVSVSGSEGNFAFTAPTGGNSGGSLLGNNKIILFAGAGLVGAWFLLSRMRG